MRRRLLATGLAVVLLLSAESARAFYFAATTAGWTQDAFVFVGQRQ